jgi:hypothetical protein
MAGTLKVGGKVLATHNSETDEVSLGPDKLVLPTGTSDPSTSTDGTSYFNTSLSSLKIYNNGSWGGFIFAELGTFINPAVSAQALIDDGQTDDGFYYIQTNAGAKEFYCYLNTFGPWVAIGRSSGDIGTYAHAPGFYDNGITPTESQNGSRSLFDFPDALVNNVTRFRWYDPQYSAWVEWLCGNLTTIKANPTNYIASNDAFQFRLQDESGVGGSSTILNGFAHVNATQLYSNAPNFSRSSTASPWGYYGSTLYYANTSQSDVKGFLISNGSSYEASYGTSGLQRYNPTPYYATGIMLLMKLD